MGGHMGHEQKRAWRWKIIREMMLEHPGTVISKGLPQHAVGYDFPIQCSIIKVAGADRRHNEPELQTVGHILFAACALPAENRNTGRAPNPYAFPSALVTA